MKINTFLFLLCFVFSNNLYAQIPKDQQWAYIPIDSAKQKWGDWDAPDWLRYFGLDFGDVDGDGNLDVVSGKYIYHNPGASMEAPWKRTELPDNVDAIFSVDADGDPYADIIAQALPNIYWYEATNKEGTKYKRTTIATVPATSHVNSQGFEKAQIIPGGPLELLIAGNGDVYCISIPEKNQTSTPWKSFLIAPNTSDEGIGTGDIDGDGDVDIAAGRRAEGEEEPTILVWFENPGNVEQAWKDHVVGHSEHPIDRIEVADITGDGKAEIIVAEERYPGLEPDGHLFWFQQPGKAGQPWERHSMVQQYSINNLDIADMDDDGDIDIITAEHKGPNLELQLWKNDGKGKFTKQVLDKGKENHLGTQLADLDGDGDLDIVGAGWDHYKWMHLWRNDAVQPEKSGSLFREYLWTPSDAKDSGKFLRVGGKIDYQIASDHFPPEKLNNGFIRIAENIDLRQAVSAELILERIESHVDTKGLKININDTQWMPVPDPARIPQPASGYMYHDYPKVNIPLSSIGQGYADIKLEVDKDQAWNWPQNLIYGIVLRIYYAPEKSNFSAEVSGIEEGSKINDEVTLKISSAQLPAIKNVDYIGFYEDVNWEGDGIYRQWQYHFHRAKIRNNIGSATASPFDVTWNTEWLPDQNQDIKIRARVTTRDGLIYLTNAIEGLQLQRDYSVQLIKPFQQPANWVTREGEFTAYFELDTEPDEIEEAKLYWKSWSPCYSEGLTINGNKVDGLEKGPCYDYFEHREEIRDISILKKGVNTLTTLKTPLYEEKMVHGMEVQWPGIMMKVKYSEL